MGPHKNASLTPKGREAMTRSVVEGGLSKAVAARQFNTTPKTVAKWVDRFQAEGPAGLMDRSSRPHSSPGQTPPAACAAVEALRRQRHIGAQIAAEVGVSVATVSRILKRLGLNRLSALEPAEPVRRYERVAPGEIIHIDIKKLGKFNRIGHRITGDRTGQATPVGSAGNMCIWRSTTIRASPIRKSCRTKSAALACVSCSTPCASFEASASGSSAS
jgi:transposase